MLSHQRARRVYDRIGAFQDTQAFYEEAAVRALVCHADFASATSVFEFGCGTGRFAHRLLSELLPANATYKGVDISPKMVRLARRRLEPFADRASVILSEGDAPDTEPPESCDRFVSSYVLDLLPDVEIRLVLRAARRMLRPDGLVCLVSLSTGIGPVSRRIAHSWAWVQRRWPSVVGGCRPIDLLPFLAPEDWRVAHHEKVVAFGVTSEVIVAGPKAAVQGA